MNTTYLTRHHTLTSEALLADCPWLTSAESRQRMREYVPMRPTPPDADADYIPKKMMRPRKENCEEYQRFRKLIVDLNSGWGYEMSLETYRRISRRLEDMRCKYDWRDQVVKCLDKEGLVSPFGKLVLPVAFHNVPERHISIDFHIDYLPVRDKYGNYALAKTYQKIPLTTLYEFDDAMMLQWSEGRYYAVKKDCEWNIYRNIQGELSFCSQAGFTIEDISYPIMCRNLLFWILKSGSKLGILTGGFYVEPEYDSFELVPGNDRDRHIKTILFNAGDEVKRYDVGGHHFEYNGPDDELPF